MKQELTPWFKVNEHPTRVGWYEYTGYALPSCGLRRYWDGKNWSKVSEGIAGGLAYGSTLYSDKWRGRTAL